MLSCITVVSLRCLWKLTQHLMSHQVQHVLYACFAADAVLAGLSLLQRLPCILQAGFHHTLHLDVKAAPDDQS